MGVKVLKREYKNQFHPSTSKTSWLLGNVGDWQRLEVTFEAKVIYEATQTEPVTVDSKNDLFKLNNGRNWQDYGFDIGDTVTFSYVISEDPEGDGTFEDTGVQVTFTVQNIYKDTMEANVDIDTGNISIMPTDRGNFIIKDVSFEGEKEIQGIKFKYGLISNSNYNTGNLNSFIDGTSTEYSFAGLNTLNVNQFADMEAVGFQSGMAVQSMSIGKVASPEVLPALLDGTSGVVRVINGFPIYYTGPFFQYGSRSAPLQVSISGDYISPQTNEQIPFNLCGSLDNTCTYTTLPDGSQCFINKAVFAQTRTFFFNTLVFIENNSVTTMDNNFRFVIHRFTGGASYEYAETILLKDWGNSNDIKSTYQSAVIAKQLNIQPGDSYSLCYEYRLPFVSFGQIPWVDYRVTFVQITEIIDAEENFVYKLSANYMIHSLFETPNNLSNLIPPSILFDAGSLTDNFEIQMFPQWNNPNTIVRNDLSETERLGNTGWFNENFNGLDNNFVVESVVYTDVLGNSVSQLDYANPINVDIKVSGIKNLDVNSEFNIGFAWIPIDEEDYKEKQTPFHQNLLINTGKQAISAIDDNLSFNLSENTNGLNYQGYTFGDARMDLQSNGPKLVLASGSDTAIIKARFIPNAAFTAFFEDNLREDDRNYVLWVSVGNSALGINYSDRVSLLVDYNEMIKVIPPVGPYPGMTNIFIEHPQDENVTGVEKYSGFIEDDVLSRVEFKVDTTNDIFIRNMVFGYQVINNITGATYNLEEISVNLSNFPKNNEGIQQINLDDIRGFKLEQGNNKNWIKITRNEEDDDNTDKAYIAYFATKIRWEDWIPRDDAPDEFFNAALRNNGKHNDWLDYLRSGLINEHIVRLFVYTDVEEGGEFKRYDNYYDITFNDYDENLNIETDHSYYRDSNNDLLNIGVDAETGKPLGVILNNEYTRIEITYTHLTENFDITKMYAVTTIEVDRGAGELEHRQLSSVWGSESDNPLIPLDGETKLKFEQLAPNVVRASCLVDPARLEEVLRYKISGRIGCFPEGENGTPDGLYEPRYEKIYE